MRKTTKLLKSVLDYLFPSQMEEIIKNSVERADLNPYLEIMLKHEELEKELEEHYSKLLNSREEVNPRYDYRLMRIGSHIHLKSKRGEFIVTEMFDKGFKVGRDNKLYSYNDFRMFAGKMWNVNIRNN